MNNAFDLLCKLKCAVQLGGIIPVVMYKVTCLGRWSEIKNSPQMMQVLRLVYLVLLQSGCIAWGFW